MHFFKVMVKTDNQTKKKLTSFMLLLSDKIYSNCVGDDSFIVYRLKMSALPDIWNNS